MQLNTTRVSRKMKELITSRKKNKQNSSDGRCAEVVCCFYLSLSLIIALMKRGSWCSQLRNSNYYLYSDADKKSVAFRAFTSRVCSPEEFRIPG